MGARVLLLPSLRGSGGWGPKGGDQITDSVLEMRAGAGVRGQMVAMAFSGSLWELIFEGFEVQIGTHFLSVRGSAGDSFFRLRGTSSERIFEGWWDQDRFEARF